MQSDEESEQELLLLETTVVDDDIEHNAIPVVSDDEDSVMENLGEPEDQALMDVNDYNTLNNNDTQQSGLGANDSEGGCRQVEEIPATNLRSDEENLSDFSASMPHPKELLPEAKDIETKALSDASEFLRWHYKLNHLSFRKMKALILHGTNLQSMSVWKAT